MGFSRQEHWSGLPFCSPGDHSDSGIQPGSPAVQADSLPSEQPGKPIYFRSPNWGYLLCSQAKGSSSSKETSSLFSPNTEVLGIKLQAFSDSEINLSLQVKYLVISAILGPLEYVSLYFIFSAYPYLNLCNCMHFLCRGSGRKNFVRSRSGETWLSTHWPERPYPHVIRGNKEEKAVGPELRVLTRYLLRVLIIAWVCDKSHHLAHLLI